MFGRWIPIAAAAGLLALPGSAGAATISFSGDVLTYTATGNKANNISFTRGVEDFACTIRGTAPCLQVSEAGDDTVTAFPSDRCTSDESSYNPTIQCDVPAAIVANLGDGNDSAFDWDGPSTINGEGGNEVVLKGDGGNDTINGGPGNDALFGGDGDDTLNGGDGDDYFEGFGGLSPEDPLTNMGRDVYIGGAGTKDFVDYAGRTEALSLSLNGAADDGAAGEGDTLGNDIEQVRGGNAADTIVGNGSANWLDGWHGDDTVRGGAGEDALFGRGGNDKTYGEDGQDTIEGGDGDDTVDGGAGTDVLYGDELLMCLPGECTSNRDTILARDGAIDDINCGPGQDSATLDAGDTIPASGQTVCEQVDRSGSPTGADPTGPTGGDGASADVVAPVIQALRAGKLRRGRSIVLRCTLSEAATITFRVERRVKRGGRTRWVKVPGALRRQGAAGLNRVRFNGKLGSRRLKKGTYRIVATARDAAGNQSQRRSASLRIVS